MAAWAGGSRGDLWRHALGETQGLDPTARLALSDGETGESFTYRRFASHAGRLALHIARALGPEELATSPVFAVSLPRGANMAIAMWAALLLRGIYTPVNPVLPSDGKRYVFENTKTRVLITQASLLGNELPASCIPDSVLVVTLDKETHLPVGSEGLPEEPEAVKAALDALIPEPTQPTDRAYYIHTSGSTGRPKCVMHNHSSLTWHTHQTLVGSGLCKPDDVVLQVADCSFDLHIRDIFCGIGFGGHVVTIPKSALVDMDLFTSLFERYRVTWLECVPLIFAAAVDFMDKSNAWGRLKSLRVWSCIGAAYQLAPAQRAHPHLPNLSFVNSYAPTENSLVTTCHRITEEELASTAKVYSVPIGRPVPGWSCVLLEDETLKIIPFVQGNGKVEELAEHAPQGEDARVAALVPGPPVSKSGIVYVQGPGVFQGYLNRPDLTEQAMLRNHPTLPPLYRTGDVCHYDALGRLVFEGRRDLQIKLQGQRLEPGEIEAVLTSNPAIKIAVVRLIKPAPDDPDRDFLAAYLTLAPPDPAEGIEYRDEKGVPVNELPSDGTLQALPFSIDADARGLAVACLPPYMVPRVFVMCQVMPKTMSGKIDRLSLPPPDPALVQSILARGRKAGTIPPTPAKVSAASTGAGDSAESAHAGAAASTSAGGSAESTAAEPPEWTPPPEVLELEAHILKLVKELLPWDDAVSGPLDPTASLLDIGFNSMQLTRLVSRIRNELFPGASLGALLLMKTLSSRSLAGAIHHQKSMAAATALLGAGGRSSRSLRSLTTGERVGNPLRAATTGAAGVLASEADAPSANGGYSSAATPAGPTILPRPDLAPRSPRVRRCFTAGQIVFNIGYSLLLSGLVPGALYVSQYAMALAAGDSGNGLNAWGASAIFAIIAILVPPVCILVLAVLRWVIMGFGLRAKLQALAASNASLGAANAVLTLNAPVYSLLHFRLWVSVRIAALAFSVCMWMQGTEMFNVVLRLLGARVGWGSVIFGTVDLPELLSVGSHTYIGKSAHIKAYSVGIYEQPDGRRDPVVTVGRISIGNHVVVNEQASLLGGAVIPSHSEVEGDSTVATGAEAVVKRLTPPGARPLSAHKSAMNMTASPLTGPPGTARPASGSRGAPTIVRSLSRLSTPPSWAGGNGRHITNPIKLLAQSLCLIAMVVVPVFLLLMCLTVPWVLAGRSGSLEDVVVASLPDRAAIYTVWPFVPLLYLAGVPVAALFFIVYSQVAGAVPARAIAPRTRVATDGAAAPAPLPEETDGDGPTGLLIGSWSFFRHVVVHHFIMTTLGFPLFALQSSWLPAAILRAAGASIGRRTIMFSYNYVAEYSVPLSLLHVGDDTVVTTFAQLGSARVVNGRWSAWPVRIGNGCLVGNNSVISTEGGKIPDRTWVGALSKVTPGSIASIQPRPGSKGQVLLGHPAAALPVDPSADLHKGAQIMPATWGPTLASFGWLAALPFLCPTFVEVVIAFFLVWKSSYSVAASFGIMWACLGASVLWSSLVALVAVPRLVTPRVVKSGAQYRMFTPPWFAFHFCDMLGIAYINSVGVAFIEGPVFPWILRCMGGKCDSTAVISEAAISEPRLQRIGARAVISWNSWLQPHTYNGHVLTLDGISLGEGAEIATGTAVFPGAVIGKDVHLGTRTLVMKGEDVPTEAIWEGIPATPATGPNAATVASLNARFPLPPNPPRRRSWYAAAAACFGCSARAAAVRPSRSAAPSLTAALPAPPSGGSGRVSRKASPPMLLDPGAGGFEPLHSSEDTVVVINSVHTAASSSPTAFATVASFKAASQPASGEAVVSFNPVHVSQRSKGDAFEYA